jgi:hypothetical protein
VQRRKDDLVRATARTTFRVRAKLAQELRNSEMKISEARGENRGMYVWRMEEYSIPSETCEWRPPVQLGGQ